MFTSARNEFTGKVAVNDDIEVRLKGADAGGDRDAGKHAVARS